MRKSTDDSASCVMSPLRRMQGSPRPVSCKQSGHFANLQMTDASPMSVAVMRVHGQAADRWLRNYRRVALGTCLCIKA
jgi:hypothetical protein